MVDLRHSPIECDHIETVVSSVQDQILAHNGQADQTEVSSRNIVSIGIGSLRFRRSVRGPADVDVSKTCAGLREEQWSEEFC